MTHRRVGAAGSAAGSEYRSVAGLEVTLEGAVLRLRLQRAERRNAIDDVMMEALITALDAASVDDRVRVLVLDGAGEHFCAGADILARNADARDPAASTDASARPRVGLVQRRLPTQAHRLVSLMLSVQLPVVCRVRGWAAGLGFQLALAADFTIAAHDATFWAPFVARGFTPDSGATWLLPRRVGVVRARELLLLGRTLDGHDAAAWGAIHGSVPGDELDHTVEALVERLASGPTVALGLTKWLLQEGAGVPLGSQLANEGFALELSSRTADFREGLAAFREHRDPEFEGR